MKPKSINQILRDCQLNYYKDRGKNPTKINVWEGYKDEFEAALHPIVKANFDKDGKQLFAGVELKWTKRRRVEALPRRTRFPFKPSFSMGLSGSYSLPTLTPQIPLKNPYGFI
jgi:hypothetical protein